MTDAPEADASHEQAKPHIKETLTSIIISLAIAFTFRGFIIEGFVIPTGSMGPTLHGAYMRMQSPETGYSWAVGPWDTGERGGQRVPLAGQGSLNDPVAVTDPMSGLKIGEDPGLPLTMGTDVRLMGGDRIFVLKYLAGLFEPARYDSVVFRFPGNPRENYIKRLIGLPGEELALVDGDVFTREATPLSDGFSDWSDAAWQVQRKDEREQRQLWMPLFDSHFAPPNIEESRTGFRAPWLGRTPGGERDRNWTIGNNRSYFYDAAGETVLAWDHEARPPTDFYPYNDIRIDSGREWGLYGTSNNGGQRQLYPVSDVRASFNIEPEAEGISASVILDAHGHQFRASIEADQIRLEMREAGSDQAWTNLATESIDEPLPAGKTTRVEFWHADQRLSVWLNGKRVIAGTYDWTPAERGARATTLDPAVLTSGPMPRGNILTDSSKYIRPEIRLEFAGGPFTLHRVRLDRDIHYQPGVFSGNFKGMRHSRSGQPSRGTHPMQPMVLGPGHYFMAGDNSASSLDSRLWDRPSSWLEANLGEAVPGVVPEELIVGKAFFVYFPAMNRDRGFPIPDFGRVRWIW